MIKTWNNFFDIQAQLAYYQDLMKFVDLEYKTTTVFPPKELMFNAFDQCPLETVKVVLIGQDPYYNDKQAMGLSFSVPAGVPLPGSLKNIYKEIEIETGKRFSSNVNGDLTYLANQGVLLLNAFLTVRKKEPRSHHGRGYETLLKSIIILLEEQQKPIVYILWGNDARALRPFITNKSHFVIEGTHPSPLSAWNGFFNNAFFTKTNQFLIENGASPINWVR